MNRFYRQLGFLVYALVLRWPIWLLIWLIGRTGMLKTLFLIYPIDRSECLDFSPDIKWLREFFSGRPSPAGLIMDGWRPIGVYLVVPNPAMELMRRQERPVVEKIMRRMRWAQKISGAQAIGLAGQLGPIFEKRHNIPIEPPFYSSTHGNIFSIQKAVGFLADSLNKKPWQLSVAIVGGGLLAEELEGQLAAESYRLSMVDVRYTRKGEVRLTDPQLAEERLVSADMVINLLPRGVDFIDCGLPQMMPKTATVIDFSRPPIPAGSIPQKVVMGNRVQRSGLHFLLRLPGGWQRHELPACSMPALLTSLERQPVRTMEEFRLAAGRQQFRTALAGPAMLPRPLATPLPLVSRFKLFFSRVS